MLDAIENIRVTTVAQLRELLLEDRTLISLTIENEAILELEATAQLIRKHRSTLQVIRLDGTSAQSRLLPQTSSKALAEAINSCENLKVLAIENFKMAFQDNIKDLASCLIYLKKIESLSYKHTYLALHSLVLLKAVAHSQSLKQIDRTCSALVKDDVWYTFGRALQLNNSLQEIILGETPIWCTAVHSLREGIVSLSSAVSVLVWTPLSFYESESLFYDLSENVNWVEDKGSAQHIERSRERLQNYLVTKEHGFLNNHNQACEDLAQLKDFIAERNNPTPKTHITIEAENEFKFCLLDIAAEIFIHRTTLQEIVIRCNNIERKNPYVNDFRVESLNKAFAACPKLQSVRFETLQGTFKGKHIEDIIKTIACLPSVKVLGFSKTYLGEKGVDALIHVLRKNKIVELDLNLAGLISDNCFLSLVKAINLNSSLTKINLGSSPMTTRWLGMLRKILIAKPYFEIVWQPTCKAVMNTKMYAMCTDLGDENLADKIYYEYQKFCSEEDVSLETEWENLQNISSTQLTYHRLPRSASSGSPKEEKSLEVELQTLTTYESPLNNNAEKRKRYGTSDQTIRLKR